MGSTPFRDQFRSSNVPAALMATWSALAGDRRGVGVRLPDRAPMPEREAVVANVSSF
jgi:hypothetical protein